MRVPSNTKVSNIQPLVAMTDLSFVDLSFTPAAQSEDIADLKRTRPKVEVIVSTEDVIDP